MLRRPFLPAGIAGICALLAAVWVVAPLRRIPFEVPPPFRDAMMAIQWTAYPTTVDALLGTAIGRAERIGAILEATHRDSVFVLAYGWFLVAFTVAAARTSKYNAYSILCVLALLIGAADLAENAAIRTLLSLYGSDLYEPGGADYVRIRLFARLKWAGLALYFAGTALYFGLHERRRARLLAISSGLVAAAGALAQFSDTWAEPYALSVFGLLFVAVGYCFWKKVTIPKALRASP